MFTAIIAKLRVLFQFALAAEVFLLRRPLDS